MSNKAYVIRRKVTKIKPTPVPETTYRPPSARRLRKLDPIEAPEFFNELSRPKPVFQQEEVNEIPVYTTPIPEYQEVNFRVTHSQLQRDEFLMNQREKRITDAVESEPTAFNEWKRKMEAHDEEIRREELEKRHQELDQIRKRAKRAKKELIQRQLNDGTEIRAEIRKQLEQAQNEIEAEREEIRRLKSEMVDGAPMAVARVQQNNRQITKEIKQKMRNDIKMMHRRLNEEYQARRDNAEIVRQRAINHEPTVRGKYTSKVDITDTKFLADLSDDEVTTLIKENKTREKHRIEELIQKHREAKEAKMDRMIELLRKETEYREQHEIEHERLRAEKKAQAIREEEERNAIEAQKMLKLEQKLEKKRRARIKEAEEAEEHMRAIQARNRYLALNKKAQAEKAFQSKQDGSLRAARQRQESQAKDGRPATVGGNRQKISPELTNLKRMLGI